MVITETRINPLVIEQINDGSGTNMCHCGHAHNKDRTFGCGHEHCEMYGSNVCACEKDHKEGDNVNGCFTCAIS